MNYRKLGMNLGLGHETLKRMELLLFARLSRSRRGPPFRHAARFMLLVTLMRLRTALPLRLMARLFAVAHVTLWRYCNLVVSFLSDRFEGNVGSHGSRELIVDTTSTRVRCTDRVWHSGHKRQRVAKVQVLCDADGVAERYRIGKSVRREIEQTSIHLSPLSTSTSMVTSE